MKHLLIGAAAVALLAGCTPEDKPTATGGVSLNELSARSGDPSKAADALAAMSLSNSGSGVISFAEKSVTGADATFSQISIAGEEAVSAGALVFEGLDVVDGKATFGKLSLNDVVIKPDDGTDGEVAVGNIELVNPSPELSTWLAATLSGQEAPFPAAETVTFDSWAINNVVAKFDDSDATGSFGIGKIEVREMGGLKAKLATLSGITLDGVESESDTAFSMKLGGLSLTNLDAKFVKALQENSGDQDEMLSAMMQAAYENPMDPGFDTITLDDFAFNISGAAFAMPSLVSSVERNGSGQPVKYTTKPFTMTLNANADGGEAGAALLQGLSLVGYESLTLNGESGANYDPDKDILSYEAKSNYLQLVDGFKLNFGGKIEGYNAYNKEVGASFNIADMANGAEPDPEAMMTAMSKLTFHNFELSLDDDSLLDRAFNAIATAQGQDPAEMKAQISMGLSMAPMMAQGSGIDMALVTEATGAIGKFVAEGGTLTLKLDPKTPLSVAAIMANPDPAAYTKDSLGFTATQK